MQVCSGRKLRVDKSRDLSLFTFVKRKSSHEVMKEAWNEKRGIVKRRSNITLVTEEHRRS